MFRIPSKPHFFQPLYPGFEDKFLIPVSFFNSYLKKGQECKKVLLRSQRGKLWLVKIDNRLFKEGWIEFVKDHDLEIGDFLVFRHEGDLVFDVMVFDKSMCEKEYVPFTHIKEEQVEIDIDIEEENVPEDSTAGKKVEIEKELEKKKNLEMGKKKKIQMEKELEKQKKLEMEKVLGKRKKVQMEKELEEEMRVISRSNYPKAKAANSSVLEHPNCVIKLTHDSMNKSRMYIANNFAKKLGLPSRSCSIILKDEEEKCFPAQLLYNDVKKKFFIGSGWGYFRVLHKFKAGDPLLLEMIQNGRTPVIIMRREKFEEGKTKSKAKASCSVHEQNDPEYSPTPIAKKLEKEKELEKQKKIQMEKELEKQKVQMEKELEEEMRMKSRSNLKAKAANSSVLEHHNCVIKLTHDIMKKPRMYIAKNNARKLGLRSSCSIILKDEEENSWPAKVLYNDVKRKFYIGAGWSYFLAIHKFKAGDSLFLEMIQKGGTPVIKIRKLQEHLAAQLAKKFVSVSGKSKASSSSVIQKRFFVATVTKRTTLRSKLHIPLKFSRLHFENKKSCKVILIDLEGRTWLSHLWNNGSDEQLYIGDGWNEFRLSNNLNPGDSFVFELIENGQKPVFKMHGVKVNDKAASSSMEKPYFYVTVQMSHLKYFVMKVPKFFASMSGLDRSKRVLIKKETGKSWLVLTRLDNNNTVYMTTGWIEFLKENELEEGDVFMLELVKGGTVPEMKYFAFK